MNNGLLLHQTAGYCNSQSHVLCAFCHGHLYNSNLYRCPWPCLQAELSALRKCSGCCSYCPRTYLIVFSCHLCDRRISTRQRLRRTIRAGSAPQYCRHRCSVNYAIQRAGLIQCTIGMWP